MSCAAHRQTDTGFSDAEQLHAGVSRLRRLGNAAPVAVFHVGELISKDENVLRDPALGNVRIYNAAEVATSATLKAVDGDLSFFRSYYCVLFAMLHSPFTQTTLINPDTFFFQDPAHFWSVSPLNSTGTLFFRDFMPAKVDADCVAGSYWTPNPCSIIERLATGPALSALHPTWQQRYPHYREFCQRHICHVTDSSTLFIDRSRRGGAATVAALTALLPAIHSDAAVRGLAHGDTELWWIACELGGGPCSFSAQGAQHGIRGAHSPTAFLSSGSLPKGHPQKRGCHAHWAPLEQSTSASAAAAPIPMGRLSHANLDSFCGWEARGVTLDTLGVDAAGGGRGCDSSAEPARRLVRSLTAGEVRLLDDYRHALWSRKSTKLPSWASLKLATGKRTAAASGVDSRVHAGAVYSDRAAWCRLNAPMEAGQLIPESRALLARNALFHPDDAHFCFWVQVGQNNQQSPSHVYGGGVATTEQQPTTKPSSRASPTSRASDRQQPQSRKS